MCAVMERDPTLLPRHQSQRAWPEPEAPKIQDSVSHELSQVNCEIAGRHCYFVTLVYLFGTNCFNRFFDDRRLASQPQTTSIGEVSSARADAEVLNSSNRRNPPPTPFHSPASRWQWGRP
eukprot:scaffold11742_cov144-Skeletonema_dohrnii-CCMP3373.AAC.1